MCFIFFFSSRRRHTRWSVTGVQTCALPIYRTGTARVEASDALLLRPLAVRLEVHRAREIDAAFVGIEVVAPPIPDAEIGRASCRERVEVLVGGVSVKRQNE